VHRQQILTFPNAKYPNMSAYIHVYTPK